MKAMVMIVFSVVYLTGCASDLTRQTTPYYSQYSLGEQVQEVVLVGNKQIPLYEGGWVVISGELVVDYNIVRLLLGLIFEQKLAALTVIETKVSNYDTDLPRKTYNPCKYEKGTYTMITGKSVEVPACYWVTSALKDNMKTQSSLFRQGFQFAKKQLKIDIPESYMLTGHYVSRKSDYLSNIIIWDSGGVVINRNSPDPSSFLEITMPYVSRAQNWHPKIVEAFNKRR